MAEARKESIHLWLKNQGIFLFTSFSLHILIILIIFHIPLFPHQFYPPKIIEVKIIEEDKKMVQVPSPHDPSAPVIKKTKEIIKAKKETQTFAEKITLASKPVTQTEKLILDNLDMGFPREHALQVNEDYSWINEKLIFPERETDKKDEDAPHLSNPPRLAMAITALSEEAKVSAKMGNPSSLPETGSGGGQKSANFPGSVWLEGRRDGQGNSKGLASDAKSGSSPPGGKAPGQGNFNLLGIKGSVKGNLSAFLGMARKKIERAKRYPPEALRRNWEGKVILSFLVTPQGEIKDIKIIQSSGYKILDEEALATLQRAAPLPVPPQLAEESLKIEVPILFRIEY